MTRGTPLDGPQRETAGVTELPPPPPPPPGSGPYGADRRMIPPVPPSATAPLDDEADDDGRDVELDWERIKEYARHWYSPLTEERTWRALGYLFATAAMSGFLLALTIAAMAIIFGLHFIIVGIFLVIPFFRFVYAINGVTVRLAAWAGHPFDRRPLRPIRGAGLRSWLRALSDKERWRQVGYVFANAFMAPAFLAVGALPVSVAWQALIGAGIIDWFWFGLGPLLGIPLAVFCVGLIPRVAVPFAETKARVDAWFLGTDRLRLAEQRVSALTGQRDDILDAVAAERRRIERNLHDGVQQQLVAIGLDLGMAETHVDSNPEKAKQLIVSAREKVQGSIGELRQLGRGLHPAILEDRGIDAALSAVVAGAPIPISVHVDPGLRLTRDVEEAVYFLANEAIANVLKHSQATVASVHVMRVGTNVRVIIHDNGVGGATARGGTGLNGMRARVRAVDGTFTVTSPKGGPTTIDAEIPL